MKKRTKPLKTLILLDVSPSFRFGKQFCDALKQIKPHLADLEKENTEVHIFAKTIQKLTTEDVKTLIRVYVERKEASLPFDRLMDDELGTSTHIKPILRLFADHSFCRVGKIVIYSDLMFYDY